jgi:hypothetical protein
MVAVREAAMGKIIFEGRGPFDLTVMHIPSANVSGESVELTLYVPDPDRRRRRVRILVPLSPSVALELGAELRNAAMAAEKNGHEKKS